MWNTPFRFVKKQVTNIWRFTNGSQFGCCLNQNQTDSQTYILVQYWLETMFYRYDVHKAKCDSILENSKEKTPTFTVDLILLLLDTLQLFWMKCMLSINILIEIKNIIKQRLCYVKVVNIIFTRINTSVQLKESDEILIALAVKHS